MKNKIKIVSVIIICMICGILLSQSASAASVTELVNGYYATGWCTYSSNDVSGSTGYGANSLKSVKVYAYASYSGHYFCYGSNSGSAYGTTVASAYIGIDSMYTGIGAKAEHVIGTWKRYSTVGYNE